MRSEKKTAPATRGFQNCQSLRSLMLLTYLSRQDGSDAHSFSKSFQSVSHSIGRGVQRRVGSVARSQPCRESSQAGSAGSRLPVVPRLKSLVGCLPPFNRTFTTHSTSLPNLHMQSTLFLQNKTHLPELNALKSF